MITATTLITQAARELGVSYEFIDDAEAFLYLQFGQKRHYIINNTLGLISNVDQKIARDKNYQYLLLKDVIDLPRTKSYLDWSSKYGEFAKFKSIETIAADILNEFSLPVIIKRNQGAD